LLFVVFVIADRFSVDRVVLKQFMSVPRVFSGDDIDIFQCLNRALRDVCEVADWCRDDV